jgi:tRNA/rRNA methyltransferase
VIVAYEWFKLSSAGVLPFTTAHRSPPARREQLFAFFENLERELEKVEFFRPPEKHDTMTINLRNIFHRLAPTRQDIQTLNGVIMAIAEGRKGPARGGLLDSTESEMLRSLLAEHEQGSGLGAPVRGLARLLRRNPTEAERTLWEALTKDRRFAHHGFKRQTPVGKHIPDLVSFPLRLVIELKTSGESQAAVKTRSERRAWLTARGYRVMEFAASDIEADVAKVLDRIAEEIIRP